MSWSYLISNLEAWVNSNLPGETFFSSIKSLSFRIVNSKKSQLLNPFNYTLIITINPHFSSHTEVFLSQSRNCYREKLNVETLCIKSTIWTQFWCGICFKHAFKYFPYDQIYYRKWKMIRDWHDSRELAKGKPCCCIFLQHSSNRLLRKLFGRVGLRSLKKASPDPYSCFKWPV